MNPSNQVSVTIADPASVDAAITSRFSTRAFLGTPVPQATITHILNVASRAPSGTNTQPWRVYVVQGNVQAAIVHDVCAAHDAIYAGTVPTAQFQEEWDYYPTQWFSPYIDRRRHNGWTLYGLLGIEKGDKDKMHAQQQQNYRFFGAPVGLFFTIDRKLGRGSMMDTGMFLQNIMVAARAQGLHTCPQAAWNGFSKLITPHLGAAEHEMLVCGMSLGFADEAALINTYGTPREPVEGFARFLG
jgi:nitroreductase